MERKVLYFAILGLMWFGATRDLLAAMLVEGGARPEQAKRQVTVRDAVEMTQTGDRTYLNAFTRTGNVGKFSPDGTKFAFVTQKGNVSKDVVEFSLLVFHTADVFVHPRPQVVATLASSSNREAISHVTWLQDNDTLLFVGEQPGQTPQLYRVSCSTNRMEQVTHRSKPVVAYSASSRGESIVYATEAALPPVVPAAARESGYAVTSPRWEDLYVDLPELYDSRKQIYFKTSAMAQGKSLGVFDVGNGEEIDFKTSPNGQYAVIKAFDTASRPDWNENEYAIERQGSSKTCIPGDAYGCPSRYLLVNLGNGAMNPLLDAPLTQNGYGIELFSWTRENTVLLVNALLPLKDVGAEERERRRHNVYVAEVLLPDKKVAKIDERPKLFPALEIQSDLQQDRFVVPPIVPALGQAVEFHKSATGWKVIEPGAANAEPPDRISVLLDQDINSPPKLVAQDPRTKRKAVLLDLNPQFADLAFGKVETITWKTRDGRVTEGSLYYPPDFVPGKKYPLVVQTHGSSRDRFWVDGPFSTAFAAQPLASKGFLVLQMDIGDQYHKESIDEAVRVTDTMAEGAFSFSFFEGAVDELDRRGLIDRKRVGYTGFSRSAYHVLYGLTHSRGEVAAAVVADGVNFGYVNCVFYLVRWNSGLCEKMNGGGAPYGATLAGWNKTAPTFNLDKIDAPLLLQAIEGPLQEWEIFAGLKWLKKPVELLNFYPQGEHILVRPGQRMLSQQTTVDWYCFWLKNEEDPDLSKAGQYRRWRELRRQREPDSAHLNP